MTRRDRGRDRSTSRTILTAITGTALAAASVIAFPAVATAAPGGVEQTEFEPGRYIVTLTDDAVATYTGGVPGYDATAPDEGEQLQSRRPTVQSYDEYLTDQQADVAAEAGVEIDYSYTMAINGFAATLTAEQAATLASDRDVERVTPDQLYKTTADTSTAFLGLEGPGGVWEQTGGVETAGEGVVVGILDTGVAPENPAFAGDALGTSPGAEPWLDGEAITFAKGDGETYTGVCETGPQFGTDDCSTKLIGARYFIDGFGAGNIGDATTGPGEFLSPRDGDGHGSHTASTAAGNAANPASIGGVDFGDVSGVAPAAKISSYKVCWSGPDPASQDDDGCAGADLIAGNDQAVADGVDVINYSIGGGAATTTYSATDDAFLGAAAAGIFVSASAGNSGPDYSTLGNASPWITTVAASTIPPYEATVELGDGQAFAGVSVTVDLDPEADPVSGSFVTAASVAAEGAVDPQLCGPGTLDDTLVGDDTIVLCERGVVDRVAKSAEVARVGGIGVVLVNPAPSSLDADFHSVPTVHIDARYYEAVTAYAETEGATASLVTGNETGVETPVPQVAGFSSRGPVQADGSDLLKPDITAPGVSILAAGPNQEDAAPTYAFLSGTSMAAPHIAGLAALYLGERPNATPAEIKSALMTTAYDTLDAEGATVTDPFAQGAGHADATRYFEPGLLYLNDVPDWLAYLQGIGYDAGVEPIDGSDLNLASIAIGELTASQTVTRTVTASESGTFTASIEGLGGIEAIVEPSTFTVEAGQTQDFTVTFTRTDAALDEYATGSLLWTSDATTVRSPLAVQPITIVAPTDVQGTGVEGSVEVEVTPGGTGDIPLTTSGLTAGVTTIGSGVTGDAAEYEVTVAEGSPFARFDLDAADDTTDLDLIVYRLDANGTPVAGWQSATASADERVDLLDPEPGTYLALVDVYSAPDGGEWDFTGTSIVEGGAPLATDPAVLAGVQGEPTSYTASWAGLEPETRYLGWVNYGDTGARTFVEVITGEGDPEPEPEAPVAVEPPAIQGTPEVKQTLTATPGVWNVEGLEFAFQWQRDGTDIPGATGETYRVTKADRGTALSVVVTATAADLPQGTATSEPVTVRFESRTSVSVDKVLLFSWQRNTVDVTVRSDSAEAPVGTVEVKVGRDVHQVELTAEDEGRVELSLPKLRGGIYSVSATYLGDGTTAESTSSSRHFWVIF